MWEGGRCGSMPGAGERETQPDPAEAGPIVLILFCSPAFFLYPAFVIPARRRILSAQTFRVAGFEVYLHRLSGEEVSG